MKFETPEILDDAVDFETFYSFLRKERNPFVLRILYFLYDLYYGLSVPEASKKHKISDETGYKYAKLWRTEGIEGLIPNFSDGRPSKLTEKQVKTVKSRVRKGIICSVDDLLSFILKDFKIKYSKRWAYEFFRKLSLKDGISYPLPEKIEKTDEKDWKGKQESCKSEIFLNEKGYECLKVSKKLYFIRHEDTNKLSKFIKVEKNDRILKRYLFIHSLNNGFSLEKSSAVFNISINTARSWLNLWNQIGLNGLKIEWGGGRPCFLSDEQLKEVREFIGNNHVTRYCEIHKFILDNFNRDYSMRQIYRLVKKTKI